jgi:hypothetical protein
LKFHGYQENQDIYRLNDVHLAPIVFGAGMKAKVAVPLKNGIRVVSTSNAANGFRPSSLLSIADSPQDFAVVIKRLLKSLNTEVICEGNIYEEDQTNQILEIIAKSL